MKSFFLFIIIAFSFISLSGQKFPDELNDNFQKEVCTCLNNSPQKTMDTAGACIDNWITRYSSKFTSYIDFNSKKKPEEQFNEIAAKFIRQNRENLVVNCDEVCEILKSLREQLLDRDKKNYESIGLDSLNNNYDNQEDVEFLLTRGKYYFYHSDFENAEKDFNEILKSNPKDEKAVYFLGLINEFTGNYQKAIDYYTQLIEITKEETYLYDIYLAKKKMKENSKN